jgi:hypothetical protein
MTAMKLGHLTFQLLLARRLTIQRQCSDVIPLSADASLCRNAAPNFQLLLQPRSLQHPPLSHHRRQTTWHR